MGILRMVLRVFGRKADGKLENASPQKRSGRSFVRSCVITTLFALLFASGASAAYKFARGEVSPFKGNESSDLVTVHVHVAAGFWNVEASIYDNGSIVVPNIPPKGKGGKPCGEDATNCVFAPAMFLVKTIGFKQIRQGNEVALLSTMMYQADLTWQRLPGPLVLRLYLRGYPLSGMPSGAVQSDEVMTTAGGSYSFDIAPEQVAGGTTIGIHAR
jgi:hypothetical protein